MCMFVYACTPKCTHNVRGQRLHYYFSILIGICCMFSIRDGMSSFFAVLNYKRVLLYVSDLCYYKKYIK